MTQTLPLSAVDLPLPGTKGAPKKFKGHFTQVDDFIRYYERLCRKYNVILDSEKVENITQYCSREVREFMEGLGSYANRAWTTFKEDLRKYYEADRDSKRYKVRDLEKYVLRMRKKTSPNMAAWVKYSRGFIRIGGWLRTESKLTNQEFDLYFWKGIPKPFRTRLEGRLMSQDPDHDLSTPFPADDINKAAESLLKRDRFDNDRLPSDLDTSDEEDTGTDEDESSDTSNSDSDDSLNEKRASRRAKFSRHKTSKPDKRVSFRTERSSKIETITSESEDDGPTRKQKHTVSRNRTSSPPKQTGMGGVNTDSMEDIVNRMSQLSLDDPAYSTLYFQALSQYPQLEKLVLRPRRASVSNARVFERQPPPHISPGPVGTPMTSRDERQCYACGGAGHTMAMCQAMQELINQGLAQKNEFGRYSLKDGSLIRRQPNETLVQAVRRLATPQSNYIALEQVAHAQEDREVYHTVFEGLRGYDEQYSTDEESYQDQSAATLAAQRTTKSTTTARKEKMDSYPKEIHPRKAWEARRKERDGEKENTASGRPTIPTYSPVILDDDAIMEDLSRPATETQATKPAGPAITSKRERTKGPHVDTNDGDTPKSVRRSELQAHVSPRNMLDKVLNTPITLAVGELLAVSKEMSQQVQDVIRPKTIKSAETNDAPAKVHLGKVAPDMGRPLVASATFLPRTRGQLIKVRMECDGVPITAIIDTGSQLNIAHKKIWQNVLTRPMDITRRIVMNDANGGEGVLHGFIPEVPLTCGSVVTSANVYVGQQAPFDLLLGRPWQRGNFVSIDERVDGTYLLFKDKQLNVRFEMLATPDRELDPAVADYISQTHRAAAMFCQTGTSVQELEYEPQRHLRQMLERAARDSQGHPQARDAYMPVVSTESDVTSSPSDSDSEEPTVQSLTRTSSPTRKEGKSEDHPCLPPPAATPRSQLDHGLRLARIAVDDRRNRKLQTACQDLQGGRYNEKPPGQYLRDVESIVADHEQAIAFTAQLHEMAQQHLHEEDERVESFYIRTDQADREAAETLVQLRRTGLPRKRSASVSEETVLGKRRKTRHNMEEQRLAIISELRLDLQGIYARFTNNIITAEKAEEDRQTAWSKFVHRTAAVLRDEGAEENAEAPSIVCLYTNDASCQDQEDERQSVASEPSPETVILELKEAYRRDRNILRQHLKRDLLEIEVQEQQGYYKGHEIWLTPMSDIDRVEGRYERDCERLKKKFDEQIKQQTQRQEQRDWDATQARPSQNPLVEDVTTDMENLCRSFQQFTLALQPPLVRGKQQGMRLRALKTLFSSLKKYYQDHPNAVEDNPGTAEEAIWDVFTDDMLRAQRVARRVRCAHGQRIQRESAVLTDLQPVRDERELHGNPSTPFPPSSSGSDAPAEMVLLTEIPEAPSTGLARPAVPANEERGERSELSSFLDPGTLSDEAGPVGELQDALAKECCRLATQARNGVFNDWPAEKVLDLQRQIAQLHYEKGLAALVRTNEDLRWAHRLRQAFAEAAHWKQRALKATHATNRGVKGETCNLVLCVSEEQFNKRIGADKQWQNSYLTNRPSGAAGTTDRSGAHNNKRMTKPPSNVCRECGHVLPSRSRQGSVACVSGQERRPTEYCHGSQYDTCGDVRRRGTDPRLREETFKSDKARRWRSQKAYQSRPGTSHDRAAFQAARRISKRDKHSADAYARGRKATQAYAPGFKEEGRGHYPLGVSPLHVANYQESSAFQPSMSEGYYRIFFNLNAPDAPNIALTAPDGTEGAISAQFNLLRARNFVIYGEPCYINIRRFGTIILIPLVSADRREFGEGNQRTHPMHVGTYERSRLAVVGIPWDDDAMPFEIEVRSREFLFAGRREETCDVPRGTTFGVLMHLGDDSAFRLLNAGILTDDAAKALLRAMQRRNRPSPDEDDTLDRLFGDPDEDDENAVRTCFDDVEHISQLIMLAQSNGSTPVSDDPVNDEEKNEDDEPYQGPVMNVAGMLEHDAHAHDHTGAPPARCDPFSDEPMVALMPSPSDCSPGGSPASPTTSFSISSTPSAESDSESPLTPGTDIADPSDTLSDYYAWMETKEPGEKPPAHLEQVVQTIEATVRLVEDAMKEDDAALEASPEPADSTSSAAAIAGSPASVEDGEVIEHSPAPVSPQVFLEQARARLNQEIQPKGPVPPPEATSSKLRADAPVFVSRIVAPPQTTPVTKDPRPRPAQRSAPLPAQGSQSASAQVPSEVEEFLQDWMNDMHRQARTANGHADDLAGRRFTRDSSEESVRTESTTDTYNPYSVTLTQQEARAARPDFELASRPPTPMPSTFFTRAHDDLPASVRETFGVPTAQSFRPLWSPPPPPARLTSFRPFRSPPASPFRDALRSSPPAGYAPYPVRSPHDLRTPLFVPDPHHAASQQAQTGQVRAQDLAGMVNQRAGFLRMHDLEFEAAHDAGLQGFLDFRRQDSTPRGAAGFEVLFPYPDSYGNPFLFPTEQLRLRQCYHFWTERNASGRHNRRLARLAHVLHFRTRRGDEAHVRRMRDTGRLGPEGSFPRLRATRTCFPPRYPVCTSSFTTI